jgi:hypothetical protein
MTTSLERSAQPAVLADGARVELIDVSELARRLNVSVAGAWLAVRNGRLRAPFYPLPRAPRWSWSEIQADLEATRCRPADKPRGRASE